MLKSKTLTLGVNITIGNIRSKLQKRCRRCLAHMQEKQICFFLGYPCFHTNCKHMPSCQGGYKGLQGWPTARVSGWWQIGWWNKINQCRKLKLNLTLTWGVCSLKCKHVPSFPDSRHVVLWYKLVAHFNPCPQILTPSYELYELFAQNDLQIILWQNKWCTYISPIFVAKLTSCDKPHILLNKNKGRNHVPHSNVWCLISRPCAS